MRIYVGNLSHDTTEQTLQQVFTAYGQVISATIITDKFTGRPRGFGFVEMPDLAQAQAAIAELNGKELDGRALAVNEARAREPRERSDNRRSGYGGERSGYDGRRPGYGSERSGYAERRTGYGGRRLY
jgi:RNA recognition motif-containing protein